MIVVEVNTTTSGINVTHEVCQSFRDIRRGMRPCFTIMGDTNGPLDSPRTVVIAVYDIEVCVVSRIIDGYTRSGELRRSIEIACSCRRRGGDGLRLLFFFLLFLFLLFLLVLFVLVFRRILDVVELSGEVM